MIRRITDISVALMVLILLSPLLLITILAILIESRGNPFYGGWRIGKDGIRFRMWKFRSMVQGADRLGGSITAPGDTRITHVGRFLRATKIDELPQFLNLLLGDLTIVGPRPEAVNIVERYSAEQMETLKVAPGITGPGQLYYTTTQALTIPKGVDAQQFYIDHLLGEKLLLDLQYLKCRTPWTDLSVVLQTIRLMAHSLSNALHNRHPSPASGRS